MTSPKVAVPLGPGRSSTPPVSEKVGSWILSFGSSPPPKPPRSHNSEFDTPALDPSQWSPPRMEDHNKVLSMPRSPARSRDTALLNEELNAQSPTVPNYGAIGHQAEDMPTTPRGSVNQDRFVQEQPQGLMSPEKNNRHLSYESWGNLGEPRESTFGPMIIKPGQFRKPGETPAFAAGIPLPAMSEFGGSMYQSSVRRETPSVVPITVETPSEPQKSRNGSRLPSENGKGVSVTSESDDVPIPQVVPIDDDKQSQPRSRASTPKAPSVSHSHATRQTRAHSPERAKSPLSQRSKAPTNRGYFAISTPVVVPLPASELGSIFGDSPSKAPSHRAPTELRSTALSHKAPSSIAVSHVKEQSRHSKAAHSQREALDDADNGSMFTEHSAPRTHQTTSKYQPSARGTDAVRSSATPAKKSVDLHPLTSHNRSVLSSGRQSPYAESNGEAALHGHAAPPSISYQPSLQSQLQHSRQHHDGGDVTPTQSRPQSPGLDEHEQRVINDFLLQTPRTSYTLAPSQLAAEVHESHFHDNELCLLLHAADDPTAHELVRKTLRKAIKARLRKLGLKHDNEAVNTYRNSHANLHQQYAGGDVHSPAPVVVQVNQPDEPPLWARDMMEALQSTVETMHQSMQSTQARLDDIDNRISVKASTMDGYDEIASKSKHRDHAPSTIDVHHAPSHRTPETVTIPIQTVYDGNHAGDNMYPGGGDTEIVTLPGESLRERSASSRRHGQAVDVESTSDDGSDQLHQSRHTPPDQDLEPPNRDISDAARSPHNSAGRQYLEEEIYKLRRKPPASEHAPSHHTWELARDGEGDNHPPDTVRTETDALPEIPDTDGPESAAGYDQLERRAASPALPALPTADGAVGQGYEWHPESDSIPPWQRIHQRLLDWAIVWPMTELDQSLNSTLRGHQVNEVALSIWTTQTYKRYVRTKMMDYPRHTVDRLFVPPNIADAINNAVFNGRHGEACGMLRDLWHPFGLEGMPRLLVVLARHRKDQNHWVVHRFSLPDGGLTTYDSFPERSLPDGRPLGWWFAIRIAWPHAMYPSPDHLVQKIVRLHRPLQLLVDNSVAAGGVWRNILMGSRPERSIDLERLRDLINSEVKNLRQRKEMGKLSLRAPKPNWEEIAAV